MNSIQLQLVVDPSGSTGFATIAAAMEAAGDGETIHLRPGEYRETLRIDKRIELVGDGRAEEVRLVGTTVEPLLISAGEVVTLHNITLVGGSAASAVRCDTGILDLQHCIIEGGEYGIHFDAGRQLSVDSCHIHHCRSGGIYSVRGRAVTIAESLIEFCGGSGILSEDCADLEVRRCRIADTADYGIRASGKEVFEVVDTEFENNGKGAILDNNQPADGEGRRQQYRRRVQSSEEEL